MPDSRPPPTVSDLLRTTWQRRRLAGAVSAALAAPALIWVAMQAPAYEASARLVVGDSQSAVSFQRDREPAREFALVNTYRELLSSPSLLRTAAESSGLAAELGGTAGADPGELLGRRLRVTVNRDSWVLTAILRDADPARAEQQLAVVIDTFFDRLRQSRRSHAGEDVRFVQEQLVEARRRLAEADARSQRFRQETGIISADVRDNHSYQRMLEFQRQRVELDRRQGETRSVADQVQTALRLPAEGRTARLLQIPAIIGDKAVADQQEVLRTLREREAQLGEKYLEKHPRLLEVRAQIKDREAALSAAAEQVAERLNAENTRLQRESAELDTRLVEAETAARVYRDNLDRLALLDQELRSHEEVVRHLTTRAAEQEVTANLQSLQISLADPPTASSRPVGLPRSVKAMLILAGAVVAGAVAAILADLLDRRVRGSAQLGRIARRPVLGALPHLETMQAPDGDLPPAFAEAVRMLRTAVGFALPARETARILALAPVSGGDGCSHTAVFLATAAAAAGERVLLVDANLRQPALARLLALADAPGLAQLLAGEPGISPVGTRFMNLDLMGAGTRPDNPAELLSSHCLPEWLALVRPRYDLVIIDTPAAADLADAAVVAAHVDGVLLVARHLGTTGPAIDRAVDRLAPLAGKLVGAVLVDDRPDDAPTR